MEKLLLKDDKSNENRRVLNFKGLTAAKIMKCRQKAQDKEKFNLRKCSQGKGCLNALL